MTSVPPHGPDPAPQPTRSVGWVAVEASGFLRRGAHRRPLSIEVSGTLSLGSDPAATEVRLVLDADLGGALGGSAGTRRVRFRSSSVSGDGRAGIVRGRLDLLGRETTVAVEVAFEGSVIDALGRRHAVFTAEVPLAGIWPTRHDWLQVELDFVLVDERSPAAA